ncbi:hypothetical protein [Trichormus sp. NMC-1]|uniref:PIN domain-containing protein n=1 Tax=Trichormus sp. NMC-1 TaxID=1853259 RepID=UPI0031BBB691
MPNGTRREALRRNRTLGISWNADVLIAATAITHDLILVSNNSDLLRIEGVNLENWL